MEVKETIPIPLQGFSLSSKRGSSVLIKFSCSFSISYHVHTQWRASLGPVSAPVLSPKTWWELSNRYGQGCTSVFWPQVSLWSIHFPTHCFITDHSVLLAFALLFLEVQPCRSSWFPQRGASSSQPCTMQWKFCWGWEQWVQWLLRLPHSLFNWDFSLQGYTGATHFLCFYQNRNDILNPKWTTSWLCLLVITSGHFWLYTTECCSEIVSWFIWNNLHWDFPLQWKYLHWISFFQLCW
jgi:hypothetical protein